MDNAANPLIPTAYDLVWTALALTAMTLLVIALVSLRRHRPALTSGQVLTWSLLAIFLPVIGPAAWLLAGRPVRSAAAVE